MNGQDPLSIPPAGEIDLLSLGGLVIRLDSGMVPVRHAREAAIHVSGGEYNVAANLAAAFGGRTAIASAMVDYPIGALVEDRVRSMGVTGIYRRFAHDGVRGPNIATVYSDRGFGARAPVVFYNRADEAAARLAPGDFDWPAIFAPGVRWFHSGGIFAALSATAPDLIAEAMAAARGAGAVVSLDLNFRAKLWDLQGGEERAQEVMGRLMEHVDVVVGNEEDLQRSLGIPGPSAEAGSASGAAGFRSMVPRVLERHPQVRVVATTLRQVHSASRHTWSAAAWIDGAFLEAPRMELDVYDRVGGGDGFAAGFFHGLLSGLEPERALRLGWAHGALLVTTPGDTTMVTRDQVEDLAEGGSARIQR